MPILLDVLSATDMYPVVFAVGGLDDGLVEVGVLDYPVEPAVQNLFVGMGQSIVPLGVRCLGNLNVGRFAKDMLGGIDATDLDVMSAAFVDEAIDDCDLRTHEREQEWTCRVAPKLGKIGTEMDCKCQRETFIRIFELRSEFPLPLQGSMALNHRPVLFSIRLFSKRAFCSA